jgi:DNA-binding transcriptional regulator YdaS (Cro superfamily)
MIHSYMRLSRCISMRSTCVMYDGRGRRYRADRGDIGLGRAVRGEVGDADVRPELVGLCVLSLACCLCDCTPE